MPATYYAPFFVSPTDKNSVDNLKDAPYVWVGFIIAQTSLGYLTRDLVGEVVPLYVSNDVGSPGGERFRAMIINGEDIPAVLSYVRVQEVGLLGFQKADGIPPVSLAYWIAPPGFERMTPKYMGRHPYPGAVTVRNAWDDMADTMVKPFAALAASVRNLVRRPRGHQPQ